MRTTIAILKLHATPFYSHQVDHYASRWAQMGFYITYSYDGNNLSDADIIVLCIDRTIVPASIVKKLMNVKAKILNFSILDISKRQFSSLILKQNDPWPGKAIVKTNRNAHGGPELMQQVNNNGEAKAQKHDLQTIDAATLKEHEGKLAIKQYVVYPTIQDVPDHLWNSPDLIVERFIEPNTGTSHHRVYFYSFFGNRGICGLIDSTSPLVRWENASQVSYLQELPPIVYEWKKKHRIDFGRFDFLKDNDQWHLIDINKTEGSSAGYQDIPLYEQEFWHLSKGIYAFL